MYIWITQFEPDQLGSPLCAPDFLLAAAMSELFVSKINIS